MDKIFNSYIAALLLVLLIPVCHGAAPVHSQEYKLKKALLIDTEYDPGVRPVRNWTTSVAVIMNIALNQIIDLDERQQILHSSLGMQLWWKDEYFVWDPVEYGGLNALRLSPNLAWCPDITLYSDIRQDNYDTSRYNVIVTHDGMVSFLFPFVAKTSCKMNVAYFPFDEQSCKLKFGSWTYDLSQVDVINKTSVGDTGNLMSNGEWDLLGFTSERNELKYNCCPQPYPDVTFTVHIQRRSMYYVFNLVLPCFFIVIITVLGFYLPPESGEKVSLGVTVLLTLTVFLLLVAESTPPQSEVIPLVSQYFALTILLVSLSTLCTVFVVNLHHKGSHGDQVPYWMKKLVLMWLSRLVCKRKLVNLTVDTRKPKERMLYQQINNMDHDRRGHNMSTRQSNGNTTSLTIASNNSLHGSRTSIYRSVNCVLEMEPSISPTNDENSQTNELLSKILRILKKIDGRFSEKKKTEDRRNEWQLVAMVIDRLFMWIFLCATVTMTMCIFGKVL